MFGLFFMAVLAGVSLEGEDNQKFASAKSIVSVSSPMNVSVLSSALPKPVASKSEKVARLEIRKLPLPMIFEEKGLDKGQIVGWSKDKEGPNSSKGESAPDWMK